MGKTVSPELRLHVIKLMFEHNLGQREIQRETGLSRPYLRSLAEEIGYQFPRNGIEVLGRLCMCLNCDMIFRRHPSKVYRARRQFCSEECKKAYMTGPEHPMWKNGSTMKSFSEWVKNQSEYKKWREEVLERDMHKCSISGRTDDLQVHHIFPKAEGINPEKAFDVNNGITLNKEVHNEIHQLIHRGSDYEEAVETLRKKYNTL